MAHVHRHIEPGGLCSRLGFQHRPLTRNATKGQKGGGGVGGGGGETVHFDKF